VEAEALPALSSAVLHQKGWLRKEPWDKQGRGGDLLLALELVGLKLVALCSEHAPVGGPVLVFFPAVRIAPFYVLKHDYGLTHKRVRWFGLAVGTDRKAGCTCLR